MRDVACGAGAAGQIAVLDPPEEPGGARTTVRVTVAIIVAVFLVADRINFVSVRTIKGVSSERLRTARAARV
jgi:hypothetical protein